MRPISIVNFERLYLGALVLGLINSILTWKQAQDMLARPEVAAAGLGQGFLLTSFVIGLAIPLLLWYFVARRGSNVAKWVLVVLFGVGLIGYLMALRAPTAPSGIALVLSLVSTVLQAYAIFLLFRADAVAWLTGRTPVDTDSFK